MKKQIAIATLAALSTSALAGEIGESILHDGNSSASFNNTTGQYSWTVDGTEHLYAQEFYFRRSGFNDEQNINTMDFLGQALIDTNPFSDDRYDAISTGYSDGNGLEIDTLFTLRGGTDGSGAADIAEQISITNTGTSTIFLSFFQFVDFDLGGDAQGDFGEIINANAVRQSDAGFTVSETIVTPVPTRYQVGSSDTISSFWSNGVNDDLNGDSSWQGDVAWAFQWDIILEAGDSFLISKDKSIVPAPGSLALLASAGLIATRRRRI